jgi:hypothetical protein
MVHSIDVTSSSVVFPEQCEDCEGRTVTFRIDYEFTAGESYFILIDGGVHECVVWFRMNPAWGGREMQVSTKVQYVREGERLYALTKCLLL